MTDSQGFKKYTDERIGAPHDNKPEPMPTPAIDEAIRWLELPPQIGDAKIADALKEIRRLFGGKL